MLETQKTLATRTAYIALGAPVVVSRMIRDYSTKLIDTTQTQFDTFAEEGEKTARKLQGGNVVEEIQHRVDLDKVQDRVGKLRDQLEGAVQSWRESFTPREAENGSAHRVTVEDAPTTTEASHDEAATDETHDAAVTQAAEETSTAG